MGRVPDRGLAGNVQGWGLVQGKDRHTDAELDGTLEIDGAYFGGTMRPPAQKEDRVDRRFKRNQSVDRRVVVVLRERRGRALPFVTPREADGVDLAKRHVARSAVMSADEAAHWDMLHNGWHTERVTIRSSTPTTASTRTAWKATSASSPYGHGPAPLRLALLPVCLRQSGSLA